MAGIHVHLWDTDSGLQLDGPDTSLHVALVPLHIGDLVLDLLREEKTGLGGEVWARDDEVPLEPPLTSLVALLLQLVHLVLQAREGLRLEGNLKLLSLQQVAVHRDTLDQGSCHFHQPAQDGLDPSDLLLLLLQVADGVRLVLQVGEREADLLQIPWQGLGLEGRSHVAGGCPGGLHQVLQGRRHRRHVGVQLQVVESESELSSVEN